MSKKPSIFESPWRRLKRGESHINRLQKRIAKFFKGDVHSSFAETDSDGVTTYGIQFHKRLPQACTDAAVEALEALRSSLDQCGYAAATAAGGTDPKNAYFPFGDTAAELDRNIKGRCKDIPEEVRTLFRSFDSYHGGNDTLWALNKLCNANKHRLLVPMGVVVGSYQMNMDLGRDVTLTKPTWDSAKNQIIICKTAKGGAVHYNLKLKAAVAFDEINGVESMAAVNNLRKMATEAKRVLTATESRCKEIGLA